MKRKLDAGVEASGPHDFAVRITHRSSAVLSASIASRAYVRDDRDTPLMWDGMARLIILIWVRPETECFCKQDWTAQITLIRFKKIRFACALLTGALMRSVALQSTRLYGAFPAGD